MAPLSRRAFLGSVAAIPFLGRFFQPQPEATLTAINAFTMDGGMFNTDRVLVVQDNRVIPIVFGEYPVERVGLPYYRALEEADLFKWSNDSPAMILITSYDQDPELNPPLS